MGVTAPGLTFRFDAAFGYDGDPWRGEVIRRFSHAALARPEDGDRLLTLGDMASRLVPWGVALPLGERLPREGDQVVLRGRMLRVAGETPSRVRLVGPGVHLIARPAPFSRHALGIHLGAVPGSSGESGQVADIVAARVDRASREVVRILLAGSGDDLGEPVRALVGLGSGSTPTGDDVLVGLTAAALRFAGKGGTAPAGVAALRRELDRIPAGSTTEVAREMIVHSSRGAFPEDLVQLVDLLGAPGRPATAVRRAADALARVGGRSGGDMLAGALAVARALLAGGGGTGR